MANGPGSSDGWKLYSHERFINRPQIISKILEWLWYSDFKQVLSLTGSPGSGKTWILREIESQLAEAKEGFVIRINAPELVNHCALSAADVINKDEVAEWIQRIITDAVGKGIRVAAYDPHLTWDASLNSLAHSLCLHNPGLRVIVLVDGFDEVESYDIHNNRRSYTFTFADHILTPFISRPCVRMVIARRGQAGLDHPTLRDSEERLDITSTADLVPVYEQYLHWVGTINQVFGQQGSPASLPGEKFYRWQNELKDYKWDCPYVNDYLISATIDLPQGDLGQISPEKVKQCIRDLIEKKDPESGLPAYPLLTNEDIDILSQISSLGEEFTRLDLENNSIQISITDRNFRKLIDPYGILIQVPRSGRYALVGSIRNLLRDLDAMHSKGVTHD
jgi:hypothetical protein